MAGTKNQTLKLFFIIALAFVLRVLAFPPSPNWDEVSLGYNAYSILKTGHDEWGSLLPLIFRAYGDFKLPLYSYLSLLPISLLGLTVFATRFVSLLAGSLLPLVIFFIVKKLLPKSHYLPYLSALFIAISPWSIFLSRIALEANLFLLLATLSFYLLWQKKLSLSAVSYALCLFTYNSSRVLLPIYLVFFIYTIIKSASFSVKNILAYLILGLSIIVFLFQSFSTSGSARYKWVSLIDSGTVNRINQNRGQLALVSPLLAKVVHNKITYFIALSAVNYAKHFDPRYLFWHGGSNYQFNIPNFPLIYPIFGLFFIIGFYASFRLLAKRDYLFLLTWLLFSPLPSAITRDAPQPLRSILFFPIVSIYIIFGLYYFYQHRFYPILLSFFILVCLYQLIIFNQAYTNYQHQYASSWQYGYDQLTDYVKQNYPSYDRIYITKKYGEPHEFLLFFWPWDPQKYQNSPKDWNYHTDWYWVDSFDKFVFVDDWTFKALPISASALYISSSGNYPQGASRVLKNILDPSGQIIFQAVNYQ